jgi:hypothetical protein
MGPGWNGSPHLHGPLRLFVQGKTECVRNAISAFGRMDAAMSSSTLRMG